MGFFMEEEEIWKCRKHLSKHRSTGVCPLCLRDRLVNLCPDCANVRPCACCSTTSSSSCSSSFSHSSAFDAPHSGVSGIGVIGRMSHLIDSEPSFRRSRSAAFQFLRPKFSDKDAGSRLPPLGNRSRSSFWSVFKPHKSKKAEEVQVKDEDEKLKKMMRSKSVGVSCYSDSGQISGSDVRLKGRSWHFPSPIKVFRQPKISKILQEQSPLCRG